MANQSVFADEWRECLQEQYKSVVRNNDQITLKTLVGVMHSVGFSEADLRDLAFQATLRAEDVADDFVPDMEIMSGAAQGVTLEPAPEAALAEAEPVTEAPLLPEASAEIPVEAVAASEVLPVEPDMATEEAALPESVVEMLIEESETPDDIGETLEDTLTADVADEPALDAGLLVLSGAATEAELDASRAAAEADSHDDEAIDDAADEPESRLPPGMTQLSFF